MSPLLPLIILATGVLSLGLGLFPRFRYVAFIPLGVTALALLAHLLLALNLPATATLSHWEPQSLFPVAITLRVDGLAWLYGVGILALTLTTFLTGLARPGGRRVGARSMVLLLALTGLLAVSSHNLPTRALAWAALDFVYFVALLLLAEGEGLEPQAVLNLSFNVAGTLLALGAALVISRTNPTLTLEDVSLSPTATLLLTLAAALRLGLFPLHLSLPTEINITPGIGTMLRLIPVAAALELLSRLAGFGFEAQTHLWLTLFGLAAALVGAAQLWAVGDARRGLTYVVIAQSGLALLAGVWAGAAALTAQALALLLGGGLVFLSDGHNPQRPWLSALPLLGASAMLGMPLTVGFLGLGALLPQLAQSGGGGWAVLAGVLGAMGLLAAGLLHTCFAPSGGLHEGPWRLIAFGAGLGFSAVLLVLLAVFGSLFNVSTGQAATGLLGFTGWGSWGAAGGLLMALGAGLAAWRYENLLRPQWEHLPAPLQVLNNVQWVYRAVWWLVHQTSTLFRTLAALVEGEGAVLWALVVVVVFWLLFR